MKGDRRLQSISIKLRLRIFFSTVVVLMLAGSLLSFWQFRNIREHATRASRAEQRITGLLRLNNSLITLMSQLHRAAEPEEPVQFESDAGRLLATFHDQSADSQGDLREIAKENGRYAVLAGSIQSMLETLPARVSSFIQLARSNDWRALHARLFNQADHTDDVVAALVQQAESDLAGARQRLAEDLERAERRAAKVLLATALLSLLTATVLGTLLTRSITQPLADLDAGSQALAAGQFDHRVPVHGNDELTNLAVVFNRTAGELAHLFAEVQHERAVAEAAKTELQERAQELARANADLQQFAYSASHDLQEPLRTVVLYSELLQQQYSEQLDTRAAEYIGYLRQSSVHMRQLITDLLTYTQATADDTEPQDSTEVNGVLTQVLGALEGQIRTELCTVTTDALPAVRVREIHVRQVFQNLIGNAMKYRSDVEPAIHISAVPQANYWLFSIRDNGIGIDPRYSTQIFGIFKRLHGNEYPGTGIGLAICQRIVEMYGGKIWVERNVDRGSTFSFTLPAE